MATAGASPNGKNVYFIDPESGGEKAGLFSQEVVNHIYQRMQLEMLKEDFRGLMLPLTAWGEKS